jgi:hypothetical protein
VKEIAQGKTAKIGGKMRGEKPESTHQQNNKKNRAQFFHILMILNRKQRAENRDQ